MNHIWIILVLYIVSTIVTFETLRHSAPLRAKVMFYVFGSLNPSTERLLLLSVFWWWYLSVRMYKKVVKVITDTITEIIKWLQKVVNRMWN